MRFTSTLLVAAAFLGLTAAIPSPNPQATGAPGTNPSMCKAGQAKFAFYPDIYNIYPNAPVHESRPWEHANNSTNLYMSQEVGGKDARLAILVFKNIPASKYCGLRWRQPREQTNFGYYGNPVDAEPLVEVYQLKVAKGKSFLDSVGHKVNWINVGALAGIHVGGTHFEEPKNAVNKAGDGNFGLWTWPEQNEGFPNGIGPLKEGCEGEIAIFMRFRSDHEQMLVMTHSAKLKAGVYLWHGDCNQPLDDQDFKNEDKPAGSPLD
ncbi:hypothetical protein BS50DRAFT_567051, partial [Corynespora cassiicola Philippines]